MPVSPLKRAATAKPLIVAAPFTGLASLSQVLQGLEQSGCNDGNKEDAPALDLCCRVVTNPPGNRSVMQVRCSRVGGYGRVTNWESRWLPPP